MCICGMMNKLFLQLSAFAVLASLGMSFLSKAIVDHRSVKFISSLRSADVDPNFEAHLPTLLKAGQVERPSAELASELRKKYKKIEQKKRDVTQQLKTVNAELAAEVR